MKTYTKPFEAPPEFLHESLFVDDAGVLRWRDRAWDTSNRHANRPAGSVQNGRKIVSVKWRGKMKVYGASRVGFTLAFNRWPEGVVEHVNGDAEDMRASNLFERPRKARSPGRKGGLKAERARDLEAIRAIAEGCETIAKVAASTSTAPTNARRRLSRLSATGMVQPVCVPHRSHFILTDLGREMLAEATIAAALVDEADLVAPAPCNGWANWISKLSGLTESRTTYAAYNRAVTSRDTAATVKSAVGRETKVRLWRRQRAGQTNIGWVEDREGVSLHAP